MTNEPKFFENQIDPIPAKALIGNPLPEPVANHPLLIEENWIALRDSGLVALEETELVTTHEDRAAFLTGAWLLDKTWTPDKRGLLANIKPQMLRVVDVLAAGRLKNAVIEPRRSSKTTTLWCILLGRCYLNEMHMAGYTVATTQKKTAERYRLDVYGPITRKWPDPDTRPVKVYKGNGTERVEFENGSVLAVLSPDGDAFRSGAYDTLLVDEGGAASIEMGEDITSAVIPAFDTRPDGQFIVAGTAAKFRDGNILWTMLNDPDAARLRYTVPDKVPSEVLEAWEPTEASPDGGVKALIEAMHPGVQSGLTTLDKIAENFKTLTLEQFALEYLGIFGLEGVSLGIFDVDKWARGGSGADLPTPPARFALAFYPHPDQLCASIVLAWRDEDGKAVPLLADHRQGVAWLAKELRRLSTKYKVPITYDAGSQVAALTVEELNRAKVRPKLDPRTFIDVKKAAALVVDEVDREHVRHYRQPELDSAVKLAVKRKAGVNGWALGRNPKQFSDDITAAEAFALALYSYDSQKPKAAPRVPRVVG